jgi:hypothetical protein
MAKGSVVNLESSRVKKGCNGVRAARGQYEVQHVDGIANSEI